MVFIDRIQTKNPVDFGLLYQEGGLPESSKSIIVDFLPIRTLSSTLLLSLYTKKQKNTPENDALCV